MDRSPPKLRHPSLSGLQLGTRSCASKPEDEESRKARAKRDHKRDRPGANLLINPGMPTLRHSKGILHRR
jgi:hypothetical protein